jgi:NodT family efflux transporter outer membrane factor (OMF) lipoprotein
VPALCLVAALAGCTQAPAYHPPVMAVPGAFHEAGPWVPASPSAPADGEAWWQSLGDPTLDDLEARITTDNPTLAEAVGRYDAARAALGGARADLFPTIGLGADISANRQSDTRPLRGANQPDLYGADTVEGSANYELDLWGRVRNSVSAARASAQASADDVAAVRLALQAELAREYIALRGLDRERQLLARTVDAYAKADAMTQRRYAGGIADGIDTGRSGTQLADAQAQLADVENARALVEHAIASLAGTPASGFSLAPADRPLTAAPPPSTLPSTLLQRRPDIAAAERRMFAANQRIGVAKAAFFPALGLGAGGGYQSTALAGLLASPNLFWSVGPSLAVSLFDGGRRRADVRAARAEWEQATAHYRATALGAFQQVEDSLSRLHHLGDEQAAEDRAVAAASQAASLSYNRYVKGAASYLDVVTAQTAELAARRRALQMETARLQAGVALVETLGGGWDGKVDIPLAI